MMWFWLVLSVLEKCSITGVIFVLFYSNRISSKRVAREGAGELGLPNGNVVSGFLS